MSDLKTRIKISFMMGSHMDLYWMAPPRDCLDRGCDIINRALELCGEHPEYCFYIESTVFTEYYLEHFPQNKEALKKLMDAGRFEIAGCYVDRYEHMHGGESIARHHIYGQRYLKKELNYHALSTCHSDLPGLSPQIPQICALSGIKYYIRARGPLGVYNWAAPDGTKILYCSVGYSYGKVSDERLAREIGSIEKGNSTGKLSPHYVMRGGYGDLQMADDTIIPALEKFKADYPEIDFDISTPAAVFDRYDKDPALKAVLPQISGEWPVGWASVVPGNVRAFQKSFAQENYLLSLEKLASFGLLLGEKVAVSGGEADWWIALGRFKGDIRPKPVPDGLELYEAWKAEMFTQDHNYSGFGGPKTDLDRDIIKQHSHAYSERIEKSAMANLTRHIAPPAALADKEILCALTVVNPLTWERDALACVDMTGVPAVKASAFHVVDAAGRKAEHALDGDTLRFAAHNLPSSGYKMFYVVKSAKAKQGGSWFDTVTCAGQLLLETPHYRAAFDHASGTVSSLFDKRLSRELTGNTTATRFGEIISMAEEGSYVTYDFTGVQVRDSDSPCKVFMEEANDVRVSVCVETSIFGARTLKHFVFYKALNIIEIKLDMFWWGKKNECMKLCLPFNPDGFDQTRYGVPFFSMKWPEMMTGIDDDVVLGVGAINRDEIKPEYRRHMRDVTKWVDVGYGNWGVTIGTHLPLMRIQDSNIEAFFLRTGVSCGDPHAWVLSQGHQQWTYTLHPHEGDSVTGNAYRFGWEQGTPVLAHAGAVQAGTLPDHEMSFFGVDRDNIIVSAIKPAYDIPGAALIRLFETAGKAGDVRISCVRPIRSAWAANLLEEKSNALAVSGNTITVNVNAYMIQNILVEF